MISPRIGKIDHVPPSNVLGTEQSNSSVLYEDKFFLKLYRKLEDGVNPDVEVTRFLTTTARFPNTPALLAETRFDTGTAVITTGRYVSGEKSEVEPTACQVSCVN